MGDHSFLNDTLPFGAELHVDASTSRYGVQASICEPLWRFILEWTTQKKTSSLLPLYTTPPTLPPLHHSTQSDFRRLMFHSDGAVITPHRGQLWRCKTSPNPFLLQPSPPTDASCDARVWLVWKGRGRAEELKKDEGEREKEWWEELQREDPAMVQLILAVWWEERGFDGPESMGLRIGQCIIV